MVRFLFLVLGVVAGAHWAYGTLPVETVTARYCLAKDRIIVTWPWDGLAPRMTRHIMTAIDRATGEVAWHLDGERPRYGGELVVDDVVLANLQLPKGDEATALDANTGKRLWATTQPTVKPPHNGFVLPLPHAVLTGTGQALDVSTGRVLWDLATHVQVEYCDPGILLSSASYDPAENELAVCRRTAIPGEGFELTVYDVASGKSLRSKTIAFGNVAIISLAKGMVRGNINGPQGGQYVSVDTYSGTLTKSRRGPKFTELPAIPIGRNELSPELSKLLPFGEVSRRVWAGEGKRVMVLGGTGTLYCLDAERAVLVWKQGMEITSPRHEWPLVVSDHPKMVVVVYACRHVRRLKPETGEIISGAGLPEKP